MIIRPVSLQAGSSGLLAIFKRLNYSAVLYVAALLLIAGAVPYVWLEGARPAINVQQSAPGGDFTLDSDAGEVSLSDFRGRVVLLYFGFTHCPDACPTTLSVWRNAIVQLDPEEQSQVQGILVSLDPERDAVKMLGEYVRFFHPDFIGLTQQHAMIAEVASRYGVEFDRHTLDDSYTINHTSYVYLIDREGELREILSRDISANTLGNKLRELLKETLDV